MSLLKSFKYNRNKFITEWLTLTHGGESPEIFNLWSGIAAISAVMGRRYIFRAGRLTYHPNMYVIIVGPAAVRKSSAGVIAKKLISKHCPNLRFGPTDTAGRKQGLLASFLRGWGDEEVEEEEEEDIKPKSLASDFAEAFGIMTASGSKPESKPVINPFSAVAGKSVGGTSKTDEEYAEETRRNPRELWVFADEFTTFVGLNQVDMTNCLTHLYYPEDFYEYNLAKSSRRIPYPSLSILGCTTPTGLSSHLPPACIGQGLCSRCMFIYEDTPEPPVFPPPELDSKLSQQIGSLFNRINSVPFDEFHAVDDLIEITCNAEALELLKKIYYEKYNMDLGDSRLASYVQRRQEHLCKLAMVLAVAEEREHITINDIQLANEILELVEPNMSNALGEIGLDKITLAKQELVEYLNGSWPMGVTAKSFEQNARRNMSAIEYSNFLTQLISAKRVSVTVRKIEDVDVEVIVPALPKRDRKKSAAKKSIKPAFTAKLEPRLNPFAIAASINGNKDKAANN